MKVTNRNAREDRSGKHNDRNFNIDNAPHIDQERMKDNKYYTYNGDEAHRFNEIEHEFYDTHFSKYLDEQNRRNTAIRHKERNRTVDDYVKGKYTRPEDKILQIGNIREHATGEELWACALEYKDRFDALFGDHCKILDMALHMDEATPHVHVRRVWIAQDEDGTEYVSQGKALEQLGIMDPDQAAVNSKYNNAKITFTQTDIQLFQDICIEKGLDIDRTPKERRERLSTLNYKKQEIQKEIDELERVRENVRAEIKEVEEDIQNVDQYINTMEQFFSSDPYGDGRFVDLISEARRKEKAERLKMLSAAYEKELEAVLKSEDDFQSAAFRAAAEKDVKTLNHFIDDQGYREEYEAYVKERKEVERLAEKSKKDPVGFF